MIKPTVFNDDRRWRILVCVALLLIFGAQLLIGISNIMATYGNRHAGRGNRVVSCTILDRVDPRTQLAECAAVAAGKP